EVLAADAESIRDEALARGAARAAVIRSSEIPLGSMPEKKLSRKVSSIHWPAEYPLDPFDRAVEAYELAVFFALDAPDTLDPGPGPIEDPDLAECFLTLHELTTFLESRAFYQGHHLALGLAEGHCRSILCAAEKRCWGTVKGRPCAKPYQSRPSLSAMGVRIRDLARDLGWPVPAEERAFLVGMVLVD
ncbi:MAG: DUF2284 domain-containing protein, partial [Pseudomonadota bacterium]